MTRAFFILLALAAGCTVPQYQCGQWVPCARGSVQSCVRTDGARCHYLFSDGTLAECASCDDCSGAEHEVISWCSGDPIATGGNSAPPDLAAHAPGDMSIAADLAHAPLDLTHAPVDFSGAPPGSDLDCYPFGTLCNSDPWCCPLCCAGHCNGSGSCAEQ